MKTMWKQAVGVICAGGLAVLYLAGCGKDAAGSPKMPAQETQQNKAADGAQADSHAADEPLADKGDDERVENGGNRDWAADYPGTGSFYDGADLQGSVVEFSETGFSLSPATVETESGGGEVMAQAAPGSESDENNIQITYADNTVFQMVTFSISTQSEVSREDADKESVKKQSSVCVFGSCQDRHHWTADKILILRWQ